MMQLAFLYKKARKEGVKPLSDFIDQICKEIRTKEIRVELPEEEKHR